MPLDTTFCARPSRALPSKDSEFVPKRRISALLCRAQRGDWTRPSRSPNASLRALPGTLPHERRRGIDLDDKLREGYARNPMITNDVGRQGQHLQQNRSDSNVPAIAEPVGSKKAALMRLSVVGISIRSS